MALFIHASILMQEQQSNEKGNYSNLFLSFLGYKVGRNSLFNRNICTTIHQLLVFNARFSNCITVMHRLDEAYVKFGYLCFLSLEFVRLQP